MSDFIYSSFKYRNGDLTKYIQSIYQTDIPKVSEFHGDWGSVAVSKNLYNGFQPYESKNHIIIIIGGPVLYFRNNNFLADNKDNNEGTKAIYSRWLEKNLKFDSDISGPFTILIIDKSKKTIYSITDLMMFIPVYKYICKQKIVLSTHVDIIAKTANQYNNYDYTSITDFILNDIVTFPYTIYKNIFQSHPSSISKFKLENHIIKIFKPKIYWTPNEEYKYHNINTAAQKLRDSLLKYIQLITGNITETAQFISGGEDTRVLSGLFPNHLKRDSFIFSNCYNREVKIAKQISQKNNINFYAIFRPKNHYLNILENATNLIGSGHQYIHSHSFDLYNKCSLEKYHSVFGGFLADTFFKGHYYNIYNRNKNNILHYIKYCDFNDVEYKMIHAKNIFNNYFNVINRKKDFFESIKKLRNNTPAEWFNLYPISMHNVISYFYSNRRLFKIYEPFICNEALKISASIPAEWKINRKIFRLAFKDILRNSKWIFHTDGRLPYFNNFLNIPIRFLTRSFRKVYTIYSNTKEYQGSWDNWEKIQNTYEWNNKINKYINFNNPIKNVLINNDITKLFIENNLSIIQKINLIQSLYIIKKNLNFTNGE